MSWLNPTATKVVISSVANEANELTLFSLEKKDEHDRIGGVSLPLAWYSTL